MLLGLNQGGVSTFYGSYPFANLCKQMTGWFQANGTGSFTDDQGILTATVSTDSFMAYLADFGGILPVGTYTVTVPAGAKIGVGAYLQYGTPYKTTGYKTADFTFTVDGSENGLYLFCQGSCPAGLKIIMPGQVDSSTNPWHSDFLAFVVASGEKTFRTMDWTAGAKNKDKQWADRTVPNKTNLGKISIDGSFGGFCMPWEYIIDLANRTGVDPWICVPFGASDAYVSALGDLFNNGTGSLGTVGTTGLGAGRTVQVEYSNEVWNFAADYYGSTTWNMFAHLAANAVTADPSVHPTYFSWPSHGLSLKDEVRFWANPPTYAHYVGDDADQFYVVSRGGQNYVKTIIDANTIEVSQSIGKGTYSLVYTSATAFTVTDPNGATATGSNGVAFSALGIAFTMTAGGTAFVAGDRFTITCAGVPLTFISTANAGNVGNGTMGSTSLVVGATYSMPNKGPYSWVGKRTQGDDGHLIDDNYAQRAKSIWTTLKTKLGSSRVYSVLGSQASNTPTATARLASTGVAAVTQGVAIAPYLSGETLMLCLDITGATSVRPSFWSLRQGPVKIAAFPAGTTVTENAIINGAGASGTTTGIAAYTTANGRPTVADGSITGLTSGTSYDVYGQWSNTDPNETNRSQYKHRIKGTVTPDATKAATSTTSMTIVGQFNQATLTIQAGKTFPVGQLVTIELSTDPTYLMVGKVTSYNSGTGALVVDVDRGSDPGAGGTHASWNVFTRTNVFPTFAEQQLRNEMNVTYAIEPIINAHIAAIAASSNPAVELIAYEGGTDMGFGGHPIELQRWVNGTYLPTTEHANAAGLYLQSLSDRGMKKFNWFVDFSRNTDPWATYAITMDMRDLTDPRFLKFSGYNGAVPAGTPLSIANRTPASITSAPSYPYTVDTMPDASLTYTVLEGDLDANFDFSGADLRMVNGNGVNFAASAAKTLYVRGRSPSRDCIFTVSVNLGVPVWYSTFTDALIAWNSTTDTDNAAMNPDLGAVLSLAAGSGATIAGGLWDFSGSPASGYSGASLTAPIDFSKPLLFAIVVDRDDGANFANFAQIGSYPRCIQTMFLDAATLAFDFYYTSADTTYSVTIGAAGTKQVVWWFFDAPNSKIYYGKNQVESNAAGGDGLPAGYATPAVSTQLASMGNNGAKLGTYAAVNRTGMTKTDALAIVQKIQNVHGI